MTRAFGSSIPLLLCAAAGCGDPPPPAGPLGELPADREAALQLRGEAGRRITREIDAEQAAFRERARQLKSQIRARDLQVRYLFIDPSEATQRPILHIEVRGDLIFPTEYGRPGSTCSCLVHLRRFDAEDRPRVRSSSAVMARYLGGDRGAVEAVIETPHWEPGRHDVVLVIDGREVASRELNLVPSVEVRAGAGSM